MLIVGTKLDLAPRLTRASEEDGSQQLCIVRLKLLLLMV